jgi:hypothetical protein
MGLPGDGLIKALLDRNAWVPDPGDRLCGNCRRFLYRKYVEMHQAGAVEQ